MLHVCRVKMGGNFICLFVGGSLLSNSKFLGYNETALRLCVQLMNSVGAIQQKQRSSVASLQGEQLTKELHTKDANDALHLSGYVASSPIYRHYATLWHIVRLRPP